MIAKLSDYYSRGQLALMARLTKNSYDQIERKKHELAEVADNKTDQVLSIIYLLTMTLHHAFGKRDYIKALETRMKIQAHFFNLPRAFARALDTLGIYLYTQLLQKKLTTSTQSISFYQQSFVDTTD